MCRPKVASAALRRGDPSAQHPGQQPLTEPVDRVQREAEERQLHQQPAGRLGVVPRAHRSRRDCEARGPRRPKRSSRPPPRGRTGTRGLAACRRAAGRPGRKTRGRPGPGRTRWRTPATGQRRGASRPDEPAEHARHGAPPAAGRAARGAGAGGRSSGEEAGRDPDDERGHEPPELRLAMGHDLSGGDGRRGNPVGRPRPGVGCPTPHPRTGSRPGRNLRTAGGLRPTEVIVAADLDTSGLGQLGQERVQGDAVPLGRSGRAVRGGRTWPMVYRTRRGGGTPRGRPDSPQPPAGPSLPDESILSDFPVIRCPLAPSS